MEMSQGLRLTLVGVMGLAAALAMSRVVASLLFGARPSDSGDRRGRGDHRRRRAGGVDIPARTATRVELMIVLREE
jgi:hypothetical protein